MHGEGGGRAGPARTSSVDPEQGVQERALLPEEVRRDGDRPRRVPLPRGFSKAALHDQRRSQGELPVRDVRDPPQGGGPRPRLVGNDGDVHGGGVHEKRHQELVESRGPGAHRRRRDQGRRGPDRFRVRPFHRGVRAPLRCRENRGIGDSHFERQHAQAGQDHDGFQDHRPGVHSQLRPAGGGGDQGDGDKRQRPLSQIRALRRRALVRKDAPGNTGEAQDRGNGQLRPQRGPGAGRLR